MRSKRRKRSLAKYKKQNPTGMLYYGLVIGGAGALATGYFTLTAAEQEENVLTAKAVSDPSVADQKSTDKIESKKTLGKALMGVGVLAEALAVVRYFAK